MSVPKNKAPRSGGALQSGHQGISQDRSDDPRENQGISTKRNGDQRAPPWDELPGERALRLLAALWGKS